MCKVIVIANQKGGVANPYIARCSRVGSNVSG